jgi:hypothetical protein
MKRTTNSIAGAACLIVVLSAESLMAAPPSPDAEKAKPASQTMLELPVKVVDPSGKPVAKVKVTPWALRSSQGHGLWQKDDKWSGVSPKPVLTDAEGTVVVLYPQYRDVKEKIRAISVSLFVDHPEFAYIDALHIDVPLEKSPHLIELKPGVPVEVRPTIDGAPADLTNIHVRWSDGRSWRVGSDVKKLPNGSLRIPALPVGKNSILLVKLDGDKATHFSEIKDFELAAGETKHFDVPLRPSLRIKGALSDNVPRPVRHGRIKITTLPPAKADNNHVQWLTWVPIQADGTFVIDGWPDGELMQLIALCDGFAATSGEAPGEVRNPPNPKANTLFRYPQVFSPSQDEQIEVEMAALSRCVATATDGDGKPVAGVTVSSWPNVRWWNGGSQIYCHPLVRGERLLQAREYMTAIDESLPQPFQGVSDAKGKVTLELPPGTQFLAVSSDVYDLPILLGSREIRIKLVEGETTDATLQLQPRGTEQLGEWDKLAGVVFGCSTREGRRICALPGVQQKMDEFASRFRDAKNKSDPKLLSETFAAFADAFAGVGDTAEAAKWRQRSLEEAEKAKATKEAPAK